MINSVLTTGSMRSEINHMKINELSKLTGIHPETIRMYRKKGLLHPQKLENGYYDYTAADYVSLAYIRKLRGYSFPIEEIAGLYQNQNSDHLLGMFRKEKEILQNQINELQIRLRYLELEEQHLRESSVIEKITVLQSVDEKIDFYDLGYFLTNRHATHPVGIYTMMTPTVYISSEVLNGEFRSETVPIRIGIGTYRHVLDELKTDPPSGAIRIPNGLCVSQVIEITDFSSIRKEQLEPMISYAKENGLRYQSGTTGFLMNIEKQESGTVFRFRIRACIEENNLSHAWQ